MTHEKFIKIETAHLAMLAGFDWECPTFYTETFDYTNQDGTEEFEFRRNDNLILTRHASALMPSGGSCRSSNPKK